MARGRDVGSRLLSGGSYQARLVTVSHDEEDNDARNKVGTTLRGVQWLQEVPVLQRSSQQGVWVLATRPLPSLQGDRQRTGLSPVASSAA